MIYDAILVGAGHNGLVAACYLARSGRRVLVLERREIVGGAAVTEEIAPGFKVSTASYSFSLFRPDIFHDLGLEAKGLVLHPKDPQMFVPLDGGRHFFVWRDESKTVEEIARISNEDAEAYPRWNAFWEEAATLLRPYVEDPDPPSMEEIEKHFARKGRKEVFELAVSGSAAETVEHFFSSEEIRGAFASQGIIGISEPPEAPGTSWVMAYHLIGGELCGATGTWAYVGGGMGSVTRALAAAAADFGAELRTGSEVAEILIAGGRARGVRLAGGEIIESNVVLSNADPKRTLALVPEGSVPPGYEEKVRTWRTDGCVVKVNLALDELPDFLALPGTNPGPQHRGTIEISPSIGYLRGAYEDSTEGRFSDRPFMEVFIASAVDPTVAPERKHVLSAFSQWAPTGMPAEDWDGMREAAGGVVLETLAALAPNLKDAVVASQILGPPDLERIFGLTGGDIFHGSILPQQSFASRFDYATPIGGLWLCGSGARPGGGVMGAAGRNAARAVLAAPR